jgi:hypothetical protein
MSKGIFDKQENDWWKRNYRNRILIFGIMLTSFGIYELQTIWTSKSSLTQIKGTLQAADTYVTNVTDRQGHSSRKSELIFYMNEHKRKYSFVENIGDSYVDEKYEKILSGLRRADTISVWVKKSEVDEYEPKVFQIDSDKTTLLDFESVQTENSTLAAFMLVLGLGSIAFYFWSRYPDKFNNFFGFE